MAYFIVAAVALLASGLTLFSGFGLGTLLLPAFALFFPQARVQLLFPPVALRAPVFVLIFGAVEFFFGISDTLPAVAHFAHLGGMLIGMLLLAYWYVQIRRARRG